MVTATPTAISSTNSQSRIALRGSGGRGAVGIDVGTATLKVAQVERIGSRFQLSACQLLPVIQTEGDAEIDVLPAWPLAGIAKYRSQDVVATLPRDTVVFRTLQLPFGTDGELRQLIDQELIESTTEEQVFDFWTLDDGNPSRSNTREVFATSLSKDVANQFGRDLLSVGLTCRTIDATPFAIARAVQMMKGHTKGFSTLAVDLGESATSITMVTNGQAMLFRELRDSGMGQISQSLMNGLKLSASDCQQLLRSPGLQHFVESGSGSELRRAIFELTRKATDKVVGELQKTFRFVKSSAQNPPQEVILFGAGADITGMDALLSNALQTPVKRWSIATRHSVDVPIHLFGQAAGLSALTVMS